MLDLTLVLKILIVSMLFRAGIYYLYLSDNIKRENCIIFPFLSLVYKSILYPIYDYIHIGRFIAYITKKDSRYVKIAFNLIIFAVIHMVSLMVALILSFIVIDVFNLYLLSSINIIVFIGYLVLYHLIMFAIIREEEKGKK